MKYVLLVGLSIVVAMATTQRVAAQAWQENSATAITTEPPSSVTADEPATAQPASPSVVPMVAATVSPPASPGETVAGTKEEESWPVPAVDYEISFESVQGPGLLSLPGTGSFRLAIRNLTATPFSDLGLRFVALRPIAGLPATGSVALPPLLPGVEQGLRWDLQAEAGVGEGAAPGGEGEAESIDYVFEFTGGGEAFLPPSRVRINLQTRKDLPSP